MRLQVRGRRTGNCAHIQSADCKEGTDMRKGFTLIELLVVIAIM